MFQDLNPKQRSAVTSLKGPLLIFAGAGTGKTKVLTYRIVNLIHSGVDASKILAVTFTNKATLEMQHRVRQLIKNPAVSPCITTFHKLGLLILRQHIEKLGYRKNFSIYDHADSCHVIKKIKEDHFSSEELPMTASDILFELAKIRLFQNSEPGYQPAIHVSSVLAECLKWYDIYMKNCNALDFDDLLYKPLALLKQFPGDAFDTMFSHIMVDEFQDTNSPQFQMVQLLAQKHRNLCVVGDDDQSIYAFRGSNSKLILNFTTFYPEATVVKLEQNYRCTEEILSVANAVISKNKVRADKQLWSGKKSGQKIRLLFSENEEIESQNIINELSFISRHKHIEFNDTAILYRTHTQSRYLESELMARKIPYQIIGGSRFFEKKEVKDLISYLKLIRNPYDEASLLRIINTPSRGIGHSTIDKIHEYCLQSGQRFFDCLNHDGLLHQVNASQREALTGFHGWIRQLNQSKNNRTSVYALVKRTIEESRYKSEVAKQYPRQNDFEERWSQVESLIESARRFEEEKGDFDEYLDQLSLLTDDPFTRSKDKKLNANGIKLMSLHNAKGLEFKMVAIIGLCETILPHEKSCVSESDIEEERRLFYVGITRAKHMLVLSRPNGKTLRGKTMNLKGSRFLDDIPEHLIEDLSVEASREEGVSFFSNLKERFA